MWTEDVDTDQHGSRNVFHNLYIYNYMATSPVKPFFWKRYVDDVISAVSGNKAERLLSHLNSVEPSIQFTLKREKDRHLPFLDLNVSRGVQGNLESRVYRKPTHTDKYLAFDSPKDPVTKEQRTDAILYNTPLILH